MPVPDDLPIKHFEKGFICIFGIDARTRINADVQVFGLQTKNLWTIGRFSLLGQFARGQKDDGNLVFGTHLVPA